MDRWIYGQDHESLRASVRGWLGDHVVPHYDTWEREGLVDRSVWKQAGAQGLLCLQVPARYGGAETTDWRFNAVINEEIGTAGVPGLAIGLHTDIVAPYLLAYATDEQRARWLPGMVSGELVSAIAMSEPGTGSDLAAIATSGRRDGDDWIVNGSKTFTSNGILADLVVTVVRTDPEARHGGLSLLVMERGMDGFTRGRNLDKVGLHAQDTAELHFTDVRVPAANVLGDAGRAFEYLMHNLPQERLVIAVQGLARAQTIFRGTLAYAKERFAFGRPIGSFQANRFTLAEVATQLEASQVYLDRCVELHAQGRLTATDAAMAKWWVTDVENRVIDDCLQLHGGYGFMEEYPVARAWRDARVQRIHGGTNEIMKEIVGRSLGV